MKNIMELRADAFSKGYDLYYPGNYCAQARLYPGRPETFGCPDYTVEMFCYADGARELESLINALPDLEPAPTMVPGEGAPQYVMPGIDLPTDTQLSLL